MSNMDDADAVVTVTGKVPLSAEPNASGNYYPKTGSGSGRDARGASGRHHPGGAGAGRGGQIRDRTYLT
jgi:hypothetical protein